MHTGQVRLNVGDESQRVHDVAERRAARPTPPPRLRLSLRCPPRGSNWRLRGGAAPLMCGSSRRTCPCPNRFPCRSSSSPTDAGHELAASLASAPFAAEAVVVDSGSRDDTVAVAQGAGGRVVLHAFEGYGPQRTSRWRRRGTTGCSASTPRARHARARQRHSRRIRGSRTAYAMARRNLGRWLAHGEGYPNWNGAPFRPPPRACHADTRRWSPTDACDLLHASAESINTSRSRTATRRCRRSAPRPRRVRVAHRAFPRRLRFYVVKLGFLDSAAGFAHIAIGAFASFLKYAKLRALKTSDGDGPAPPARL